MEREHISEYSGRNLEIAIDTSLLTISSVKSYKFRIDISSGYPKSEGVVGILCLAVPLNAGSAFVAIYIVIH